MASIQSRLAQQSGGIMPFTLSEPGPRNRTIYETSPEELKNRLIKLILDEWKKTARPLGPKDIWNIGSLVPAEGEMAVVDTKFNISKVPHQVVRTLRMLEQIHNFGVGCYRELHELLKMEVETITCEEDVDEAFKGVRSPVDMLVELASQRLIEFEDPTEDLTEEASEISFKVILIDGLGKPKKLVHTLRADTSFQTFLRDMNEYHFYCDPYDDWALEHWDQRIKFLKKEMGMDRDFKVTKIEDIITTHNIENYAAGPQWLWCLEGTERMTYITNEERFRMMMDEAAEEGVRVCVFRCAEVRVRHIFSGLERMEEELFKAPDTEEEERVLDEFLDQNATRAGANAGTGNDFGGELWEESVNHDVPWGLNACANGSDENSAFGSPDGAQIPAEVDLFTQGDDLDQADNLASRRGRQKLRLKPANDSNASMTARKTATVQVVLKSGRRLWLATEDGEMENGERNGG